MSDSLTADQHLRIHAVQLGLAYFNSPTNPNNEDLFTIIEAMYIFIKGVTNE